VRKTCKLDLVSAQESYGALRSGTKAEATAFDARRFSKGRPLQERFVLQSIRERRSLGSTDGSEFSKITPLHYPHLTREACVYLHCPEMKEGAGTTKGE